MKQPPIPNSPRGFTLPGLINFEQKLDAITSTLTALPNESARLTYLADVYPVMKQIEAATLKAKLSAKDPVSISELNSFMEFFKLFSLEINELMNEYSTTGDMPDELDMDEIIGANSVQAQDDELIGYPQASLTPVANKHSTVASNFSIKDIASSVADEIGNLTVKQEFQATNSVANGGKLGYNYYVVLMDAGKLQVKEYPTEQDLNKALDTIDTLPISNILIFKGEKVDLKLSIKI